MPGKPVIRCLYGGPHDGGLVSVPCSLPPRITISEEFAECMGWFPVEAVYHRHPDDSYRYQPPALNTELCPA